MQNTHKTKIRLEGQNKTDFLEFVKEAKPELAKVLVEVAAVSNEIQIFLDSPLGELWRQYDECCG